MPASTKPTGNWTVSIYDYASATELLGKQVKYLTD